jgi:hypothetical protein
MMGDLICVASELIYVYPTPRSGIWTVPPVYVNQPTVGEGDFADGSLRCVVEFLVLRTP